MKNYIIVAIIIVALLGCAAPIIVTPSITVPIRSTETPTNIPTSILTDIPLQTATTVIIKNGDISIISVIVPNLFYFPVLKQPIDNSAFVTDQDDVVTQFRLASEYGSIGIIAHNYLAGASFPQISIGQTIQIQYMDGVIETHVVVEILRFQAIEPFSPYSDYINPNTNENYTAATLFNLIYNRPGYLILQTSIATEESGAWGRLFIIAERR